MKRVSTHGDWEGWITYFLEAIESQANESKHRVRKVLSMHRKYRERVTEKARSQRPLAAIDLIMK